MSARPLAPAALRRLTGLTILAATAFVVWAALTTGRPLWAEPASPTSYPRGDWTLSPGESFDTPLDPRGEAWQAIEIRPSGGASGPLDFAILDGEAVRPQAPGEGQEGPSGRGQLGQDPHRLVSSRSAGSRSRT